MDDGMMRRCVRILKSMAYTRDPPYELPADSFLEEAVVRIGQTITGEVGEERPPRPSARPA